LAHTEPQGVSVLLILFFNPALLGIGAGAISVNLFYKVFFNERTEYEVQTAEKKRYDQADDDNQNSIADNLLLRRPIDTGQLGLGFQKKRK